MTESTSDSLSGQQLANFQIEYLVKQGSTSHVYYGWDVIQRRPVAIKVIDTRHHHSPVYAERFLQEARGMMSTWWQEHIPQIYYAARKDGRYYFVMEYIDGPNLKELMAQYAAEHELMPYNDVLRIGRAVASALDYAHENDVIHRDVKPANVLVCVDGRVLLTDFGLALTINEGEQGEIFGTPEYIAPEQAVRSEDAQYQSDLYSMTAMLYEMLVGVPPFQGSVSELISQHISHLPPSPRSINPHLSRQTEAVLLKGLAKSPHDRYQTGAELMAALEESLGAGILAADDSAALPPMPAATQAVADGGAALSLSQVSVVDKIASQLEMEDRLRGGRNLATRRQQRRWQRMGGCMLVLAVTALTIWSVVSYARQRNQAEAANSLGEVTETSVSAILVPSETATMTPTSSPPTNTPTPTVTAVPLTDTPSPTNTVPPTATPTPTPVPASSSPTLTPKPIFTGPLVRFLYDRYSFYMLNLSDEPILVGAISFQALDVSGQPASYSFQGRRWGQIYPTLESQNCNAVELANAPFLLNPPECKAYNATVTPPFGSERVFWTEHENVTMFRVYWNGQEIGRCPIVAGACELHLP